MLFHCSVVAAWVWPYKQHCFNKPDQRWQEALANTQASLSTRPLRAPIPSHWAPMPEETHVRYVELPLPPDCSPARAEQARLPGKPPLDEATLSAMISQVSRC